MTDRERLINARKEARRYKRKYLALKEAIENIKCDIDMYEADCKLSLSGNDERCLRCSEITFGSVRNIIDKYTYEKRARE